MRIICNSRFCCESAPVRSRFRAVQTNLEALVLQHPLDGGVLSARGELGLEHHAKGAVAHNLALCVCQILVFARLAVLDLFADDFCGGVSGRAARGQAGTYRPF
jgi:hypothetical protein